MSENTIYVLGAGAIGFPLAAYLTIAGKQVVAVRTSNDHIPRSTTKITIANGTDHQTAPVTTISLSRLSSLDGIMVITAKSLANNIIARKLKEQSASGPIILLQNGVGVEKPFVDAGFNRIYRCVLYVSSQLSAENKYTTRPIDVSPVGIINGTEAERTAIVDLLNTSHFPFRSEQNIQREIWKKAIINVVFNSICPLLEVDNGGFVRNRDIHNIGRGLVKECLELTHRLAIDLKEDEIMDQVLKISKNSEGQLISTLQDIRNGNPTEMKYLNLEMARMAASLDPGFHLSNVELLGRMVEAKASEFKSHKFNSNFY